MRQLVIGSIPHGGAISRSSHCCKTGRGVWYLVCRVVRIKDPLLLTESGSLPYVHSSCVNMSFLPWLLTQEILTCLNYIYLFLL